MRQILLLLLGLSITLNLSAQTDKDTVGLYLDFPVFDFPYQSLTAKTTGNFIVGYANPSMKQSLAMSNNFYSAAHYGIKKLLKTNSEFTTILLTNLASMGFDLATLYVPFSTGWLHEEYHRAVMTRRQINSFNDMNTFPYGQQLIAVRKVKDDDLIRLSDNHKSDFRRLMTAGLEGQYQQVQSLQKNNFFFSQDLPHLSLYWLNTMTTIFYVNQSGSPEYFDELIDEVNAKEGANISIRDFAGPDFTAWVDALYFPEKPYEDRGVHPSGVGVNRYIKPSQLTPEALTYLQKQGNLQWLNLISPHLFGFPKIKLKSTEEGNYYGSFALRHLLTPFGNDISLDLFYQSPKHNVFVTLHAYNNFNNSFFGIEGAVLDKRFLKDTFLVSSRTILWIQPQEQSFTTSKGSFGGLMSLRGAYQLGVVLPYIELEAKTKGWAMGNVFLEENISLNLGFCLRMN